MCKQRNLDTMEMDITPCTWECKWVPGKCPNSNLWEVKPLSQESWIIKSSIESAKNTLWGMAEKTNNAITKVVRWVQTEDYIFPHLH
jgi:hypothetical protein